MIADKMRKLVENNSVVREMFEEGKRLKKLYGAENVFDFSLGNPSAPAPAKINDAIKRIVDTDKEVHGYMSNGGYEEVREKIAANLNQRFGTHFGPQHIVMTAGAASGLNVVLKSILNPADEVIVFAPFFSEYTHYIQNYDGKVVAVSPNPPTFQPNLQAFAGKINAHTKAVLINSPNNPTGVVYSEETLQKMAAILQEKQAEFGHAIYLIADEPYRELVYEDISVPYVTGYYANSFAVYSFSKSLSLPGERIGYVAVSDKMEGAARMAECVTIASRVIGCVNAPSLMQKVVANCLDEKVDIAYYRRNRDLLYEILQENHFECVKPEGAFYIFLKAPIPDDNEFCKMAKKYNLLFVPASSFGCRRICANRVLCGACDNRKVACGIC